MNRTERLDRAGFVIDVHTGNERRLFAEQPFQCRKVKQTFARDRNLSYVMTEARRLRHRLCDGRMLNGRIKKAHGLSLQLRGA